MSVVVPENLFGLASFLSDLFSKSHDECQVLPEWFAMVLDKLASHVATRASTNTIGNATPEHFSVLRTKHKARRSDTGIAVAGANSISDKRFRSTSRMAAAGNIPVARQTARSGDEALITDYVFATAETTPPSQQKCVSLDASNISGEDHIVSKSINKSVSECG